MFILAEPWFIRDCLFIALTLGLVLTCLSNTETAIEEPVTYFIAITPIYFFTLWIGACILLTYATATRARVQGWGFFFFILCVISGSLVIDQNDPARPCIWERGFEHVLDQSGGTRFSAEGSFAKANAWTRDHRPLIFRPHPASECLDIDFPRTGNREHWWYTKQETDQIIVGWLRKFGLQDGTYRDHILRLLKWSRQMIQDLEEDWEREPDPEERKKILKRRREIITKQEAVCVWQPGCCEWTQEYGDVPPVEECKLSEGNEESEEKEYLARFQPTREASETVPEQEHTGAPHTHVPNTKGERRRGAQDALGGLKTEAETDSTEQYGEQGVVETEREDPISEPITETKASESVKPPGDWSKEEVEYNFGFSERDDDEQGL